MRRFILCIASIGLVLALTACGNENISLKASKVSKSTLAVFNNGKMQSSFYTSFDKDYYDVNELESFVNEEVAKYNESNDADVKLSSIKRKKSNVVLVFDYDSTDEFAKYCSITSLYSKDSLEVTNIEAKLISGKEAKSDSLVPNKLVKYGKNKKKSASKVIKDKYKVFILDNTEGSIDGNLEIKVEGDIKFVSNVKKVDYNTVKISDLKDVAVIVFKP